MTDLKDIPGTLVVNSENTMNRPQYIFEVIADTLGIPNPPASGNAEDAMRLIDSLSVDDHKRDEDDQGNRGNLPGLDLGPLAPQIDNDGQRSGDVDDGEQDDECADNLF